MGNLVLLFPFTLAQGGVLPLNMALTASRRIFGIEDHVINQALGNMSTNAGNKFISHAGLIRQFGEPSRSRVDTENSFEQRYQYSIFS